MTDIVLASNNQGKLKELQTILRDLDWTLHSQAKLKIESVEETGLSFIENALLKARHAAKKTDMPAIADDSGLVVNALHGQPGIYSSRFAGTHASDRDNIDKLLSQMEGKTDRRAYFYCAIAYVTHSNDPTPIIAEGRWHGEIAKARSGDDGFGYDPVFYLPRFKMTAAELAHNEKNQISHRALALQQFIQRLDHEQ